jgi:hypothetical protein
VTVRDRGSATAETAILIPVLVVVLVACLWVLACVAAQLKCVDAARAGARAAARGDSPAQVREVAQRLGPGGSAVELRGGADTVEVSVRARVAPLGGVLSLLPAIEVSGRAVGPREGDRP